MNSEHSLDLVVCGGLLVGISLLAQLLQPAFPRDAALTGWVSGGLCILWGGLGRNTPGSRLGAMTTLAVAALLLAAHAVRSWETTDERSSRGRVQAAQMVVLAVFASGMLGRLAMHREPPAATRQPPPTVADSSQTSATRTVPAEKGTLHV